MALMAFYVRTIPGQSRAMAFWMNLQRSCRPHQCCHVGGANGYFFFGLITPDPVPILRSGELRRYCPSDRGPDGPAPGWQTAIPGWTETQGDSP